MKFYYLREFCCENGFNRISVIERLILSAILTKKKTGDDRDYVEILMNYDNSQEYTGYTNWQNYKDFVEAITKLLNDKKGYMSDYIIENIDNRDKLHYVTIEYSDLLITHKNAMSTIACKAFILAAANHSVNDNNDWFQFNIMHWSKTTRTHRKRTIEEIDKFMQAHNILYTLSGNIITVASKRRQEELKPVETSVDKSVIETPAEQIEEEKEIETFENQIQKDTVSSDIFNIADDVRLTPERVHLYIDENGIDTAQVKIKDQFRPFFDKLQKIVSDVSKDADELSHTGNISDENTQRWKTRKDNARIELFEMQKIIVKHLEKMRKNMDLYRNMLSGLMHMKNFTYDTGISE